MRLQSTEVSVILGNMKRKEAYLEQQLRRAIEASNRTAYRISKDSGVSEGVLSLFLNGRRGITLATASKLAETLGLELRPVTGKAKSTKRRAR